VACGIALEQHFHLLAKTPHLQSPLTKPFDDQIPVTQVVVMAYEKELSEGSFIGQTFGILLGRTGLDAENSQMEPPTIFRGRFRPDWLGEIALGQTEELQAETVAGTVADDAGDFERLRGRELDFQQLTGPALNASVEFHAALA